MMTDEEKQTQRGEILRDLEEARKLAHLRVFDEELDEGARQAWARVLATISEKSTRLLKDTDYDELKARLDRLEARR